MWTDPHISKQLLDVHLNPENDQASRKKSTIEKTTHWILEHNSNQESLNILDLGCGPGLYTEIFAIAGHVVTGIDISSNSIAYAKASAHKQDLDITYLQKDYTDIDLGQDQFDLVVLIYTDLGVLFPADRAKLLGAIYNALKPGGLFIFDVLNDEGFTQKLAPKTWEARTSGFWKNEAYLALSESFLYENEKVILSQHTIVDAKEHVETYRFWTHYFSEEDVSTMLSRQSFKNVVFHTDILPEGDQWNGKNVIFTKCEK